MFKKRIFWMILIGCGVVFLTVHHFSQKKTDPLPEKETIEVTATPVPSETEEPEQEEDVKEIVFEDEGMDEVMSVSYTHLDVYKRQGLCGWQNERHC